MQDLVSGTRAVFLDRDGTIIEDREYLHRMEQVELLPGVVPALKKIAAAGYALVVATNQSGVARGMFTEDEVRGVNNYLREILSVQGVHLRGFVYCPHLPEGNVPEYAIICECRKPKTGLVEQAKSFLGEINLAQSWAVGDKLSDVEFGKNLGTKTALLRSRYWQAPPTPKPDLVAGSLAEAADRMLAGLG